MLKSKNTAEVPYWSVGSVAKGVKTSFLRRPWLHEHGFNPHPGHIVASLDKTLYDGYLCLVALNKPHGKKSKVNRKTWKLLTPKRVRIRPKDSARGGVEDTRLEAKAKDTKKIRGQGQGQPFRGQNLSRPRTGML